MNNISSNIVIAKDLKEYTGLRIDVVVSKILDIPRNRVQSFIKEGFIKVNSDSVHKNYKLKEDDEIFISIPEARDDIIEPTDADIKIVYEDNDIVVIDKPAGLVVHPGAAKEKVSVVSALKYRKISLSNVGKPLRGGVVHRIDKQTSGVIVLAKTDRAHFMLAKQFFSHTIDRRYIGIVHGNMKDSDGEIDMPIGRHKIRRKEFCVTEKGKRAKTMYKVIKRLKDSDVVLFKLFTGRTHQIRVHMKYLNHPILGDKTYYKQNDTAIKRQALHAFFLEFIHPTTLKKVGFYSKLPKDMMKIIKNGG